jgi:hypothetical protein
MYKRIFFHSLVAGVLAAMACVIYNHIYFFATEADFSRVLNTFSMTGYCIIICLVAGFIYWAFLRWLKRMGTIIFNFLFSILSFAAVAIPISVSLPLDIQFPELFPGLAVPMIFFPLIAWYTVQPLFTTPVDK